MDNNQLINLLIKTVIDSIDDSTVRQLAEQRGFKTTNTNKPLEDMDADELAAALRNVDGVVLWKALGEDDGIWELLDDKDAYIVQAIKDDPSEYLPEFSPQDLRLALRDHGNDMYASMSASDLLDEIEAIVEKLRSKSRY